MLRMWQKLTSVGCEGVTFSYTVAGLTSFHQQSELFKNRKKCFFFCGEFLNDMQGVNDYWLNKEQHVYFTFLSQKDALISKKKHQDFLLG